MADYALGLNATGLESVAVTVSYCVRQNWSQTDLGSIGSMSVMCSCVDICLIFQRDWVVLIVEEKQKSNVT